jgi:hypothetical protein
MCNALIGAKTFEELERPISFGVGIEPGWYTDLKDGPQLEAVWEAQEKYVKELLGWISDKEVESFYFDGAYEKTEAWFEKRYAGKEGKIRWDKTMIEDIPKVNIQNVFIKAKDGSTVIFYETWDTIFVKDPLGDLPKQLIKPTITLSNLRAGS